MGCSATDPSERSSLRLPRRHTPRATGDVQLLVGVREVAFLTKTLPTANRPPEWGGEQLCFCSWTSPVIAGSRKGTTTTSNDRGVILALLGLIGAFHLTSVGPRILPEEY